MRFIFLAIISLFLLKGNTFAGYPEKPITIVVHSKPGSGIDIASRLISNIAKKYSDATIIVENKPGGSGTVAMRTVLGMRADGYTILAVTKSFISTMLLANTGIGINNFDWLALMISDPECLIVNNTTKIRTLEDIIKDAKQKNGEQKWLGPLVGGLDNLFAEEVWEKLNIKAHWIPYESGSDAIVALMGKQGAVYVGNPGDISGRPTLSIAVVAAEKRLEKFPDVPTFVEKGYDIKSEVLWRGFALKKGTPPKIKKYLTDLFAKIAKDSIWINFVNNSSAVPVFYDEEAFSKIVAKDQEKARYYLQKAGLLKPRKAEKDKYAKKFLVVLFFLFLISFLVLRKVKPAALSQDTVIAMVLFFLSVYVFYLSAGFPSGKLAGSVGPATIPQLWAVILALFTLWLIVKNFINAEAKNSNQEKNKVWKATALIILMAAYLVIMPFLGYYISTAVFLIAGMLMLNYKNYLVISLTVLGFLISSYYVIQLVLQVPLPAGRLFN